MAIQNTEQNPGATRYFTASSDEVLFLHSLVAELGGMVSMVSFRITKENARQFAEDAATKLASTVNLDQPEIAKAFYTLTLEELALNKLAVILRGPNEGQLVELAETAELLAVANESPL